MFGLDESPSSAAPSRRSSARRRRAKDPARGRRHAPPRPRRRQLRTPAARRPGRYALDRRQPALPHLGANGQAVGCFVPISTSRATAGPNWRESEERLASSCTPAPRASSSRRDGCITDANPPLLALLGYSLEEFAAARPDFVAADEREPRGRGHDQRRRDHLRIGHRCTATARGFRWSSSSARCTTRRAPAMTIVRDLRDRLSRRAARITTWRTTTR